MPYKCGVCGKFIKKNATECKFCGTKDPAILEITPSKTNTFSSKIIQCPNCRSSLKIATNLQHESKIQCLICNHVFNNPLHQDDKKSIVKYTFGNFLSDHKKGVFWTVFALFVLIVALMGNRETTSSKEWEVAAQNQTFEIAQEKELPSSTIDYLEHQSGQDLASVLDYYIGRPIGGQEILYTEPLLSLIKECVGENILRKMTYCKKSDEGLTKSSTSYVKYTYDCYEDIPNGNYFAFSYIYDRGIKAFFIEVKIDGKMYNASVSD